MDKNEKKNISKIVADSVRAQNLRSQGYREKALKMYPHICGRCSREFAGKDLRDLTVHHRDHDHANNPADGSNWELLCLYCHDNEHQRQTEALQGITLTGDNKKTEATHNPFADLKSLLKDKS